MESSRVPPFGTDIQEGEAEVSRVVQSQDRLERIRDALTRRDEAAKRNQRRRLTFAAATSFLAPFAVFFLACQIKLAPSGPWAKVWIAFELFALTAALGIAFLHLGESHYRWIGERLRAEILRRESFLLLAQVGPYLKIPEAALSSRVEERLIMLENELDDPAAMLAMNDGQQSWSDALEDSFHAGSQKQALDLSLLQHYLEKRVADQRQWFSQKSLQHERHTWYFESLAKLILTLGLIVAAIHFGLLWNEASKTAEAVTPPEPLGPRILIVAAIVLPAAGAAFVGLLSIFGCRRLSVSYAYHADALERLENQLRALESDAVTEDKPYTNLDLRFKRLMLETESVLSNELRLWWFFMHPELPGASG
jgi:hypothetical protein